MTEDFLTRKTVSQPQAAKVEALDAEKIRFALERVLNFSTQHVGAVESYDAYTRNEADKIILRQFVLDNALKQSTAKDTPHDTK